jgi:hypothetical protein
MFLSAGKVIRTAPFDHIKDAQQMEEVLSRFRGDIMQVPPMFVFSLHVALVIGVTLHVNHRYF